MENISNIAITIALVICLAGMSVCVIAFYRLLPKKVKHEIYVGFDYTDIHGWVTAFYCVTHNYIYFEGECPHGNSRS